MAPNAVPAKRKKSTAAPEPTGASPVIAKEPSPKKKRSPKTRAEKADVAMAHSVAAVAPAPLSISAAPLGKPKKRPAADIADGAAPKKRKPAKAALDVAPTDAIATASKSALEAAQVTKTALDVPQVERAVRALLTHVKRERGGLLDDADPPVHVLLATKQMPKAVGKATACKPVPLTLPHPYLSLDTTEVCLITKDPQREYKDKLAAAGVRAKVIGITKLKKKHKEFEAKRRLLGEYEVFLADARVLPMLPPLLGKSFFQKRKLPTAVDLKKTDIRAELEKAVGGALYRHTTGTSNSLQVGTCAQTTKQLVDNIVAVVEQAVKRIPGKWTNIQSLSLRTTNSVALPFLQELPHA